ncbi:oligosaccharide flippase family protein [Prosthecobacter sp. SYSU 5D2]
MSPFIINGLGFNNYGAWLLATSFAGYLEFLDLGFSTAAVRSYSRAIGTNNTGQLRGLFEFLQKHYLRLGVAVIGLGGLLLLGALSFNPGLAVPSVTLMTALLIVLNGIVFSFRARATLLKARLEYGKIIGTGLARLLVFTGVVVWWGEEGVTLWKLIGLQVMLQILEQVAVYFWAGPLVPKASGAEFSKQDRSIFLSFAKDVALSGVTTALRHRIDVQLLGWYVSMASISHYSIGSRLPSLFFDMVNSVFGGHLMAGFTQMVATNDPARVQNALFRMLRLSGVAAVTGGTGICVFGPVFIECWLGTHLAATTPVLQMLTLGAAVTALHYPVISFLGAINAWGTVVRMSVISAALNFICSWILVQQMGTMGVVWGTFGEQLAWSLLLWPVMIAKETDIPLWKYVRVVFFESALPLTLTTVPLCLALRHWMQPDSFLDLALCTSVVGVHAAAACCVLDVETRDLVMRKLGIRK